MKIKATLIILFFSFLSVGQNENKFLDRKFWKQKPNIETINKLIAEGNSLTEKNRHAMDATTYAILEDNPIETIKYLIGKGIDVNTLTHDKRNYLFWAGYKANLELMKFFVDKGAKTDIKDSHGLSLIQFTAFSGSTNPDLYNFCIEQGADIKELDKRGRNVAFMYVSNMKDVSFLDFFTKKGIDIYAKDKEGNGLFNHAASSKDLKVLKALKAKNFPVNLISEKGETAMSFLTRFRHRGGKKLTLEAIQYLESLGIKSDFVTKDNNNILHNLSFATKDVSIIKEFIGKKGINPNLINKKGNTPLMNASYAGNKEVLALFIKHSDVNLKNKKGETALTTAIKRNKPEVVSFLLENNADVTVKNKKGDDLIFSMVDSYRRGIENFNKKLHLLISKGLNAQNSNKDSKLIHKAVKKGNLELLNALLENKLDVNGKNKDELTPLQVAVMIGKNLKIIKTLLKAGADKSVKTVMDESVYELAKANELFKNNNIDITLLK